MSNIAAIVVLLVVILPFSYSFSLQRYHSSYSYPLTPTKTAKINYKVTGREGGAPVLLIHGFGGSVNHFRHTSEFLERESYRVVAVDLIGFGGSDKPSPDDGSFEYSMELFRDVSLGLINHVTEGTGEVATGRRWVIAGNSIGGLAALMVGSTMHSDGYLSGIVLFNTSGGMSSFRYSSVPLALRPVLWIVRNVVLKRFGDAFWERFKSPSNVENILRSQVYPNDANVDDDLLDVILGPSNDEGARDVFLSVFGGDPGPTPEDVIDSYGNRGESDDHGCGDDDVVRIIAVWGTADSWTPIEGGRRLREYCSSKSTSPLVEFELVEIEGAGHCLMDERPRDVEEGIKGWLEKGRERL